MFRRGLILTVIGYPFGLIIRNQTWRRCGLVSGGLGRRVCAFSGARTDQNTMASGIGRDSGGVWAADKTVLGLQEDELAWPSQERP